MFNKKIETPILNSLQRSAIRTQMDQKAINHEFFLLVREHKYQEALALGLMFIKYHPENAAISKFCYFIEHNKDELNEMVDDEMNYTDGEESDDDNEEEDSDDQEEQQEGRKSAISKISQTSAANSIKSFPNVIKYSNQNVAKIPPNPIKPQKSQIKHQILANFPSQKSCSSSNASTIKSISSLPRISKTCLSKQNLQICKGHTWSHNCKNPDCPNRKK